MFKVGAKTKVGSGNLKHTYILFGLMQTVADSDQTPRSNLGLYFAKVICSVGLLIKMAYIIAIYINDI